MQPEPAPTPGRRAVTTLPSPWASIAFGRSSRLPASATRRCSGSCASAASGSAVPPCAHACPGFQAQGLWPRALGRLGASNTKTGICVLNVCQCRRTRSCKTQRFSNRFQTLVGPKLETQSAAVEQAATASTVPTCEHREVQLVSQNPHRMLHMYASPLAECPAPS